MQNEYMTRNGLKACVVSVSGGIDSAVTYALMLEAAKQPGSPIKRTLGIAQPIHRCGAVAAAVPVADVAPTARQQYGSALMSSRRSAARSSLWTRRTSTTS